MNQIWIWVIVAAIVATSVFLIMLLIELRKTAQSLREFLKTTGESTKTTLDELQQSLKSLRDVSDDIKDVTDDVKTFSDAIRDVGLNVKRISNLVEDVSSSALIKASGFKVGLRTALGVLSSDLLSNLFKKGGRQ
jgi:uncharacterized protein YoxC